MLTPEALRMAAEQGGTLLGGAAGNLLLIERIQRHSLPRVLILGRTMEDLRAPMEAAVRAQAKGLELNLLGLLPLPGCDLTSALLEHRIRIGALVAALDGGLPWLEDRPMLIRRLPGRIVSPRPLPLFKAPLAPLEKAALKTFLEDWEKGRRRQVFRTPAWREVDGHFETDLWPGVPLPEGALLTIPPLELPCATPLMDALRSALRHGTGQPIPFLPMPDDPSFLHALRGLTPEIAAFHGPAMAWEMAMVRLASLPAPPHFCARC
jgi:hypothetical protein